MISQSDFLKKIEELKNKKGADLSTDEDLSLAVMNLISLEEHFFFTSQKTKNDSYLEMMNQVREMRKELLAKLMPKNEGETWCISKHLLAATMRLLEVGTKTKDKKYFAQAYQVYSLFWGIKFGLVDAKNVKKIDKPWTMEDLVTKMVDCCRE
jgi:rhamnogalacturonyl hydrolase YesR